MKGCGLALLTHEKTIRCDIAGSHWQETSKRVQEEGKDYHQKEWNVFVTEIGNVCIMQPHPSVVCWVFKVGDVKTASMCEGSLGLVSTQVSLTSRSIHLAKLPFFQKPVAVVVIVDLVRLKIVEWRKGTYARDKLNYMRTRPLLTFALKVVCKRGGGGIFRSLLVYEHSQWRS